MEWLEFAAVTHPDRVLYILWCAPNFPHHHIVRWNIVLIFYIEMRCALARIIYLPCECAFAVLNSFVRAGKKYDFCYFVREAVALPILWSVYCFRWKKKECPPIAMPRLIFDWIFFLYIYFLFARLKCFWQCLYILRGAHIIKFIFTM